MRSSIFETIVGALVIILAGAFLVFALDTSKTGQSGGSYKLLARFDKSAGIEPGSDVLLAGVKVGRVLDVSLDAQKFQAVVTMSMPEDVELPDDSDARIISGLLGGSYISVEPGGGYDVLPTDGTGEIIYTRGSVDLLTLVGGFMSQMGQGDSKDE